MAAFVAVKPLLPVASLRPALGFGHGGHRLLHRSNLLPVSLRRRALPSLRCSADENPEPADATVKSEEKPEEPVKHVGSSIEDFGGWSPDEPEEEGSWKAGMINEPFFWSQCCRSLASFLAMVVVEFIRFWCVYGSYLRFFTCTCIPGSILNHIAA